MDLRQAVEMVKRILTKEKIDRLLAGQVPFDMTDGMEQKIDKLLVIIGKLVTEDEGQNRPFKP